MYIRSCVGYNDAFYVEGKKLAMLPLYSQTDAEALKKVFNKNCTLKKIQSE